MRFYYVKFREIRIQKKVKIIEIAERMGVNRSTIWLWEKGKVQPSEKKTKLLANILNVPPEVISDIKPEIPVSETEFGTYKKVISSWITFKDNDLREKEKKQNKYLSFIKEQLKESSQAISVLSALINFSDAMLYVKDANQKYIAASKTFLKLVSLPEEQSIIGKTDYEIFPKQEAKKNLDEDEGIIRDGKPVRNKESLIPGTRKRKWGIISKVPSFDSEGKVTGIIGSFIDITERKNNEILIEQFKKSLGIMDEAIWMAKKAVQIPEGGIKFEDFIYAVDDKLRKALLMEDSNLSFQDMWEHTQNMAIDNNKRNGLKLRNLIREKEAEVRLKLVVPENQKVIYAKHKIYYDPLSELFVGVISEDTESRKLEKMFEILKKNKIDKDIINELKMI